MATMGELEKQIFDIEGFNVRFSRDGRKVRSDCGGFNDYSYKNAAYDNWTAKKWINTRAIDYVQNYEIEVLEFNGTVAANNRTLKKLRESYQCLKQPQSISTGAACCVREPESTELLRIEKEMNPDLQRENFLSIPSIEIAVDYVPEKYQDEAFDLALRLIQEWIVNNSFAGTGVVWQWCCAPTVDFMHLWGPVVSEFLCLVGLPKACREYVATKLEHELGKAIKYPADPLGKGELVDALPLAYVEDGIVWQSLDSCTWLSVAPLEAHLEGQRSEEAI